MPDLGILLFLVAAGFVAAFIDSQVGGGGIISLPALLVVGLDPHMALGTNKLAATGASFTATVRYTNAGVVNLPLALLLIPFAGIGSFVGSLAVLQVQARWITAAVIAVMVAMTVYVVARRKFGLVNQFTGLTTATAVAVVALAAVVGFYDGFLGPGTGSFLLFGFVGILRMDFVRAAGLGRVLNFTSNLAALTLFALKDSVLWEYGLPMMAAHVAGAYLGSHVGLKHGARWLKPLFVTVSILLMARLAVRLVWAV